MNRRRSYDIAAYWYFWEVARELGLDPHNDVDRDEIDKTIEKRNINPWNPYKEWRTKSSKKRGIRHQNRD